MNAILSAQICGKDCKFLAAAFAHDPRKIVDATEALHIIQHEDKYLLSILAINTRTLLLLI